MTKPDLNLLFTLDALLSEGSVTRAAQRLHLSPSAMSRALARLRATTGDPLLVRAGRGLVATPRALALREQVSQSVRDAEAVLRPATVLDLGQLARTFTLRSSDGFVETFGPALLARVAAQAPGVQLRFVGKPNKESSAMRDGDVDLETAVVGPGTAPELIAQGLFRDRFIGVVSPEHPLAEGVVSAARYAQGRHIGVSRPGLHNGPAAIDLALQTLGLQRRIVTVVGGFSTALALVRSGELIASVPEHHTTGLRQGLHSFALPLALAPITVSLLWPPRLDADPGHRWLRGCVREVCAGLSPAGSSEALA